jgi:polysaccharide biosynthesis protein PslG
LRFLTHYRSSTALRAAAAALLLGSTLLPAFQAVHAEPEADVMADVADASLDADIAASTDADLSAVSTDTDLSAVAPSAYLDAPIVTARPKVPLPADRLAASNYGMNVFVWGNPDTTARDLQTLTYAGFGWQKSLFKWREMNPFPGNYNFNESDRVVRASNVNNLRVVARIDFQPYWARDDQTYVNARPDNFQWYADFVRVFADRYKAGSPYGHVDAIEIWNEPNLKREWGESPSPQSAANYVQMLKLSYQAIKSVDPSIQVVTAGLSPTGVYDSESAPDDQFLQWMFDAGLSGNYDILGLHGNSQAPDPTADPGSDPTFPDGSFYFRRVEQLRAIQESNGDYNPVWLLEFGWTSDPIHADRAWYAVSEDQKAANILSAMQYARANWPWMGLMTLWDMPDPTWGPDREEYWWGVSNGDGTSRPALDMLIQAAQTGTLPV